MFPDEYADRPARATASAAHVGADAGPDEPEERTMRVLYCLIGVESGHRGATSYQPGLLATYDCPLTRRERCIIRRTSWRGDAAARERAWERDERDRRRAVRERRRDAAACLDRGRDVPLSEIARELLTSHPRWARADLVRLHCECGATSTAVRGEIDITTSGATDQRCPRCAASMVVAREED